MDGPEVSSGRALEAALDAMHGVLADALTTELRMHLRLLEASKDSKEPYMIPPQFLDKVLKFLAQNGINAPAAAPKVDALAMKLDELDLDQMVMSPN